MPITTVTIDTIAGAVVDGISLASTALATALDSIDSTSAVDSAGNPINKGMTALQMMQLQQQVADYTTLTQTGSGILKAISDLLASVAQKI